MVLGLDTDSRPQQEIDLWIGQCSVRRSLMGGPPVETLSQPCGWLKIIPEAFQAKMVATIFVRLEENEVGGRRHSFTRPR
jgi:hypothetical protein